MTRDAVTRSYRDLPGYETRSIDDLRFEVLAFERLIKDYLERKEGLRPKKEDTLKRLIGRMRSHPLYPELTDHWSEFVKELDALRDFRNKFVHSEFDDLPSIEDLFVRFENANRTLSRFKISSARSARYKSFQWTGDILEMRIDDELYKLDLLDVHNLLIALHPATRGRVNFIKGRLVQAKVLDYYYEKVTYFIEGFPPFELTHDESMTLEDLLHSMLGRHLALSEQGAK